MPPLARQAFGSGLPDRSQLALPTLSRAPECPPPSPAVPALRPWRSVARAGVLDQGDRSALPFHQGLRAGVVRVASTFDARTIPSTPSVMARLVRATHAWCVTGLSGALSALPLRRIVFMGGPNKSGHDGKGGVERLPPRALRGSGDMYFSTCPPPPRSRWGHALKCMSPLPLLYPLP
jgi:hypothetical protein